MPDPCEYIVERVTADAAHVHGLSALMEEYIACADVYDYKALTFMTEHISCVDAYANKLTALEKISETTTAADATVLGFKVSMDEAVTFTDAWANKFAVIMRESVTFTELYAQTRTNHTYLSEAVSASETVLVGFTKSVTESIAATDVYSPTLFISRAIAEGISCVDTFPSGFSKVIRSVSEYAAATVLQNSSASMQAGISESISVAESFWSRNPAIIAWQMNTETSAVSWNTNFEFDSIAQLGNVVIASAPDGIYVLQADDDNGTPIDAVVTTGFMDLNDHHVKRFDGVFYGLQGSDLKLTMEVFGGSTPSVYNMPAKTTISPGSNRIIPGKGLASRYWRMTFNNVAGGDFDIDNIEFDVAISKTRRM